MDERRVNCREFMKCGREEGGRMSADLEVCPAFEDASFDGINSGKRAGRICWAVAGTSCGGKTQGSFAENRASCTSCDFFVKVPEGRGEERGQNR
jgi:hypothetical protein